MKKYKYINSFPKPFLEDLVKNKCLPIIGAGFSKNAIIPKGKKMPDWEELGKDLANNIQDYKYTNPLDAISAYCHEYSKTNLVEKLSELLLVDTIKAGNTHKAFCDLQFDIVCTTNFEFLLEQGYSLLSKYCYPITSEEQLSISNSRQAITLLKLHGDLHHPNKLVVTEEDYDRFLTENPMLATYLANLLITRTPLFIGYSLDDTNFRQIWQVIKERLGNLRRQAYVIKVNVSPHEKARYERRGVKVINIKGNINNYPTLLEEVFIELKDYWNTEFFNQPNISEEATLSELALPVDTNNRLCFFSVPIKILSFYKEYIFPIAKSYGLVPISADDVISEGDNWIAKITALISRAEFVVLDVSSKNTKFELGLTLNQHKEPNKILVIKSDSMPLSSELKNLSYFTRKDDPFDYVEEICAFFDGWLRSNVEALEQTYDEEPKRLIEKREYKAAVISAMTLLEVQLKKTIEGLKKYSIGPLPLHSLFRTALDFRIINENQFGLIKSWMNQRNKLVHTKSQITSTEAKKIVKGVYEILDRIDKN
ncbi:MAG: SIR2 family protein [Ignavibacteriae bacterium]|nr:SIR2 family protein [Ignavibacteriota bacterium]